MDESPDFSFQAPYLHLFPQQSQPKKQKKLKIYIFNTEN
jgi:hypothetical protein